MIPYEGKEKYIFVSYAHKDSDAVLPIIESLSARGYRVWYDEGIEAGTEWPAYIESHLDACAVVLVFISPSAVASFNCRCEINYALMQQKEMLIVYLEDTVLAQGMGLQLGSLQSLFRNRHDSFESFFSALEKAAILFPCKREDGEEASQTTIDFSKFDQNRTAAPKSDSIPATDPLPPQGRFAIKEARKNGPSLIANIGSIPSNTPQNAWPKGTYTSVINTKDFSTVHFHCTLLQPVRADGLHTVGKCIYDSDNHLVHEDLSTIQFQAGNDRISVCWNIRDASGMVQKPDTYTLVVWMDNSCTMEYSFRLIETAPTTSDLKTPEKKPVPNPEIDSITRRLRYPKLWRCSLFAEILLFFAILFFSLDDPDVIGFAFLTLAGGIFFSIRLIKLSAENVFPKHKAVAFFVVCPGLIYYSQYLLVMLIVTLACKKNWQARLEELQKTAPYV